MNVKTVNVLSSQQDNSSVVTTPTAPDKVEDKPKSKGKLWMRRAPRPNAYQRMCQRHDRW